MFKLSQRSKGKMEGVHPDLIELVERAIEITEVDFGITSGVRTEEEQRALVEKGASTTMNSKHRIQADGFAHAVDVVAYIGSDVKWDWPLYHKIADAFKRASAELNIELTWGGDWKSFPDGPHYQLGSSYRK